MWGGSLFLAILIEKIHELLLLMSQVKDFLVTWAPGHHLNVRIVKLESLKDITLVKDLLFSLSISL